MAGQSKRCAAATSSGRRCQREGRQWYPLGEGRKALLCEAHVRAAYENRLRLAASAEQQR